MTAFVAESLMHAFVEKRPCEGLSANLYRRPWRGRRSTADEGHTPTARLSTSPLAKHALRSEADPSYPTRNGAQTDHDLH